jgi:hypothetical protein
MIILPTSTTNLKPNRPRRTGRLCLLWIGLGCLLSVAGSQATPVNKIGFVKYYDRFLAKRLDNCTTCHLPPKDARPPTSLADFPHNPFGHRLAVLGAELRAAGKRADIATRLRMVANEDSDGDGVDNLTELLLGHAPGDPKDRPTAKELAGAAARRAQFAKFLASYRWEPFETVHRPPVPKVRNTAWVRNPIDAFVAAEHESRHLRPRPPASRAVLLRRVYLDLIGLSPTPEALQAFERDTAPDAYEKVVDRLLASPRYGERWGRHWMDVWRYSDWAGWVEQVRDSKPHIWRWRDWIVESLNKDKGFDRMVQEMLAADELAPEDPDALRATGYLVRNFKLLSREQWLEDTVNHTSRAFLGVTMGCAKCHNHMYDPVLQVEYYRLRAVFEPHNVRTDRVPGEANTDKNGLVRAYDADPKAPTYLFYRGDERNPDKEHPLTPGVPEALGGTLKLAAVSLPRLAYQPDKRDFVVQETIAAGEQAVAAARKAQATILADAKSTPETREQAGLSLAVAEARHAALLAVLRVEKCEDAGDHTSETWKQAAMAASAAQREAAFREAEMNVALARSALAAAQAKADAADKGADRAASKKAAADLEAAGTKSAAAEKALTTAKAERLAAPTVAYKPRPLPAYPAESTGRRLAFARWLTDRRNPLAARVAMNHIWARHFGQGIVPSVADFGRNGRPPSHPQLLDWLAAEFMSPTLAATGTHAKSGADARAAWSMKRMHRLIVTSSAYRMASTPDADDARRDPDNTYLWRMSSRRMEAEVVRDNILFVAGQLDETMGGPEVDHNQGLNSHRRSLYLRIAAEKEVEFLKIFDSPSVTECYERKHSVMPQQALALANSELTLSESRLLARALSAKSGSDSAKFTRDAFLRVLARRPTPEETRLCLAFLTEQVQRFKAQIPLPAAVTTNLAESAKPSADPALHARENLVLVLFNHNDFVTVR